jgi:flagellar basal-body rod protein FlgG
MLRSLYTAATGMEAQQTQMDVIAHNLANASTTGFKKERAEFSDLLSDTIHTSGAPDPRGGAAPAALQVGLGVRTDSTTRTFTQGDLQNTGNSTDIAIQGDGLFRVQQASGELAYTRAGNLRLDATGRLVTQAGDLIEPGITVPPGANNLTIKPDGTVTAQVAGRQDVTELGTLALFTFPNYGALQSVGGNLYKETQSSGVAVQAKPGENSAGSLNQGFLETANVKAVEEMINMITTQRAYEMNSKVIQSADQMLQKLTSLR